MKNGDDALPAESIRKLERFRIRAEMEPVLTQMKRLRDEWPTQVDNSFRTKFVATEMDRFLKLIDGVLHHED